MSVPVLYPNLIGVFLLYGRNSWKNFSNRPLWLEKTLNTQKICLISIVPNASMTLFYPIFSKGLAAGLVFWAVYALGSFSPVVLIFPLNCLRGEQAITTFATLALMELSKYLFSTPNRYASK